MREILRGICLGLVLLAGALPAGARELTILLSNDDGFEAPGLAAMRAALQGAGHRVVVVAPREDQSGSSVKITTSPLAFRQEAPDVWVVDGSPADAVWVGLRRVLRDSPPDIVVTGSNRGQNVGAVTNLSGTVGAAVIGALNDVPAIAVSVGLNFSEAKEGFPSTVAAYPEAARFTVRLIAKLAAQTAELLPPRTLLNVNYPALAPAAIKGARWARLGREFGYDIDYRDGEAPGTVKLALGPETTAYPPGAQSDTARFAAGYITVSVLDADWLAPRATRVDAMRRVGDLVRR